MPVNVFPVCAPEHYRRAGPMDLVELLPVPGDHPLFVRRSVLETLVCAIATHEPVHLSGPTGSAKSSLIQALHRAPLNFDLVCAALGLDAAPLRVYPIEMATFESPAELWQRRALRDGATWDEPSAIVTALRDAERVRSMCTPLIWLREMGRVCSASVQGGLCDLVTRGDVVLPDGTRVDARGIGWIADSNYQSAAESTHTLVTFDDALRRRFSVNLTLDYLPAEQEALVLRRLAPAQVSDELITLAVRLGQVVRRERAEGNLLGIAPPTIDGYLAFLRMGTGLAHLPPTAIAMVTLLGNAGADDARLVPAVLQEVFGLEGGTADDDSAVGAQLF